MEYDGCGFRVKPEIELTTLTIYVFWIVGLWIDTPPHNHKFLGQFCELRIQDNRCRNVHHGTTCINAYLMGVFMHHANEKVSCVLPDRLRGWFTFPQFRYVIRCMRALIEDTFP